ncbi:MAG: hypothetical protein HY508_02380, partial [Acidobacteria bacterium]|nr:hypothetical protein [Acidobacteriota bacterium]
MAFKLGCRIEDIPSLLANPSPLVVEEKECTILSIVSRQDHGAADTPAKLVLSEQGLGCAGEEIPRVQGIIAQILEHAPVKFIGAGFCDRQKDAAARSSILSTERVGQNPEFLE